MENLDPHTCVARALPTEPTPQGADSCCVTSIQNQGFYHYWGTYANNVWASIQGKYAKVW